MKLLLSKDTLALTTGLKKMAISPPPQWGRAVKLHGLSPMHDEMLRDTIMVDGRCLRNPNG